MEEAGQIGIQKQGHLCVPLVDSLAVINPRLLI